MDRIDKKNGYDCGGSECEGENAESCWVGFSIKYGVLKSSGDLLMRIVFGEVKNKTENNRNYND